MIERVQVMGARGRVGSAVSARLAERGVAHRRGRCRSSSLLCVPDRAIGEVAAAIPAGPWIAHVSGATPLRRLDPHVLRFGLHPLQTFTHGARAGAARRRLGRRHAARPTRRAPSASWLAETLGLRPFALADDDRAALPRGRRDRLELPRDAATRRGLAARGGGRAAGGARPAHARA